MSIREANRRKQIHLAAHFPGVNNTTVWSDPSAGSQIDFESFVHLARTAERGLFDFFFLAEGLRLREHRARSTTSTLSAGPTRSRCWPRSPQSPSSSAWPAPSTPPSTNPTSGKAIRDAGSLIRRASGLEYGHLLRRVHRGELPPRRLPRPRRSIQKGRGVHHRCTAVLGQLSTRRRVPTSPPGSTPIRPESTPSSITVRSSTSAASPRCPRGRKAIQYCCRPATRKTAATSAPSTPTPCSPCTDRSRRVSATTPM